MKENTAPQQHLSHLQTVEEAGHRVEDLALGMHAFGMAKMLPWAPPNCWIIRFYIEHNIEWANDIVAASSASFKLMKDGNKLVFNVNTLESLFQSVTVEHNKVFQISMLVTLANLEFPTNSIRS